MPSTAAGIPTGAKLDRLVLWALAQFPPGEDGYLSADAVLATITRRLGWHPQDPTSPEEERLVQRSIDRLRAEELVTWDEWGGFAIVRPESS